MRKTTYATLPIILLMVFLLQGNAGAQVFRKKIKEENQELRQRVDSLQKALDKLKHESILKDSIAGEMIDVYEENKLKTAASWPRAAMTQLSLAISVLPAASLKNLPQREQDQ